MKTILACAVAAIMGLTGTAVAQTTDEISRRQALGHYRTGLELMFAERYAEAEREFSAAIALDPLLTLAHYGLGQSFMAQKRFTSAIYAFIGCRDAYGALAALYQRDVMASERRLDDERQELRDSVQRVRSGQIKGAGPAMLHQLEKRLDELETMRRSRGRERLQTPAEVSLALGSAYFRNNQPRDAEREWLAAVSVNPRLGEAHNNLAVVYMLSGRKKEAEEAVKAAERARFRVNPQLKEDIRQLAGGR
jgi:tetratricopeptide (TPR) repeat protein